MSERTQRIAAKVAQKQLQAAGGIDWTDPLFAEAVETLSPHVKKIETWLSANTTIKPWTVNEVTATITTRGKGARIDFLGKEKGRGRWTVSILVMESRFWVYAEPEKRFYPGWKSGRAVALGNISQLGNPATYLQYAQAPLELIFKDRK